MLRRHLRWFVYASLLITFHQVPSSGPIRLDAGVWQAVAREDGSVEVRLRNRHEVTFSASTSAKRVTLQDGVLSLEREAFTEEWAAHPGGLEQRWRVERAPKTPTLRFTVKLDAKLEARRDDVVVHTRSTRLRYGTATWVDAQQRRTVVAQRVEGDSIVMELDAQTLRDTTWPAVLDPAISQELSIGAVGEQLAPGWQDDARIVFDGLNYLAVWVDGRADRGDLYFARASSTGDLRDSLSSPLVTSAGEQHSPALAFGGGVSLAAWIDSTSTTTPGDVRAARISPTGQILDSLPLLLTNTTWDEFHPAIAFDGTNFLVAWLDARAAMRSDVYGVRVSPQGVVLDAMPVQLTNFASQKDDLALAGAASGGGFILAWVDSRPSTQTDLYVGRYTATLGALDGNGTALDSELTSDVEAPRLTPNADLVLVTWTRLTGLNADVYATRFSMSAGAPTDTMPIVICNDVESQWSSSAVAETDGWLVGYLDDRDDAHHVYRVSGSGVVGSEVHATQLGWGAWRQSLFSSPTEIGIFTTGGDKVTLYLFNRMTGFEFAKTNFPLSSQTQFMSAVAGHGSGVLLASMIDGAGIDDPFGADIAVFPLTPTGASAGPMSLLREDDVAAPAIATNGTNALVVFGNYWGPGRSIYGRRVGLDGVPIESDVFTLATSPAPQWPRVASNGTDYLVVWHNNNQQDLGFARVTSAGALLDPTGRVLVNNAPPSYRLDSVDVAWNGQQYVVVWRDDNDQGSSRILATHVTAASGAVEGNFITLGGSTRQWDPTVGSNAAGLTLVAWADERLGTTDIFGARLYADGGTPDADGGFAITTVAGDQYTPTITWDGARFLVAWVDEGTLGTEVHAATVDADGTVSSPFVLSTEAGDWNPRLASSGLGRSLVSYQRFTLAPPLSSTRTYLKGACFAGTCEPGAMGDGGVITTPDGGTSVALMFTSTPNSNLASCNQPWAYRPTVNTAGAVTWTLRNVDGELPSRVFINSETGEVFWHPSSADEGSVSFDVVATSPTGVASQRVEVTVTCKPLGVGCSCDASPMVLVILGLALFRRRHNSRRVGPQ